MRHPLLYSFRRCPYAIRARLALLYAEQKYELQEVSLKEKPANMLEISPKGTVPVMQLTDGSVLDESLEIALWALRQSDPHQYLPTTEMFSTSMALIKKNDHEFKHWLDLYKYADRHPQHSQSYYRCKGEVFLSQLDTLLGQNNAIQGEEPNLTDIAILPFVRQFAGVDRAWFDNSAYTSLQNWLERWLSADSFIQVMAKAQKNV